jgi:hypothetical protein
VQPSSGPSPQPSAPAGAYWWLVWSNDRNTFVSYYSTPASFTVRPLVTLLPLNRGKVIWERTENDDNLAGSTGSTSFTWRRPRRLKQGTRLTLRVSLVAKGATKNRALVVRAP